MNQENSSYLAGEEVNKLFAKRQLELANGQAAQEATIADQGRKIEGLQQQINDLNAVVASLSQRPRRSFWIFTF